MMKKGIIGKKLGITQIFTEDGSVILNFTVNGPESDS